MLDPRQKMANICPNLITKTEAHNLLSSECKRPCGDNPFQLHHPDQPGSEGTSESDPWALTRAATDPFDIQDEWRLNATQFPNLAIASRAILAIPATSVRSECAFSAGGRICNNLQGSLKAGTIAAQNDPENRFNNPNQNCSCSPHPHDQNHEESASFRWRPSGAARGAPRGQGFRTDALKALGKPGLAQPRMRALLEAIQLYTLM
ncbi:hypothetical protein CROQUDRAFT_90956 [Cronartium quercuum f. sp. fusiforme G11]|uniref:HAT C-terminal dimerisation domain-containing protein n=1 Tax=Cronartium quercuum f. sp. fusiforme G11 TaxID=708437 RepID=A0A9P6NLM3_9BASI|nr:hypothetical protein CROQUDRAFT_90956 [Cronartium quercuum f. sp. fusiforme G11]